MDFNSLDYKRSRNAYTAQAAFEYFIALLITDVFLAKLLSSIGISDASIGIISSFVSLAFIMQLASIFLLQHKISVKKTVIIFDTLSIFLFAGCYIVPFLPISKSAKTVIVILAIIVAYFLKYIISSIYFKWANSFVEPSHRARYSATKEIISLFSGMIFTLVIGYIVDKFESLGNLNGAFLFLSIGILVLNICNFISLSMIKKEVQPEKNDLNLKDVLHNTLGVKNFRSVVLLITLHDMAKYFTFGFMGIYKTKELALSVLLVQVINIISNLSRMFISKPIGRYSDNTSFTKGFRLGLVILGIAFFINIFTTPDTWFFVILFTILYNSAQAGTNANSFNIIYSYVNTDYFTQAMAIKNCICGICGFFASIMGGKVLDMVQNNSNMVFGIHIYGQQLLSLISFMLVLIAIIFSKFVLEKKEINIQ